MAHKTWRQLGIELPRILLPVDHIEMQKWAVVACDQFTSQREYWEEADRFVGEAPSTLRLIIPEAYLPLPDKAAEEKKITSAMADYLEQGVFRTLDKGAMLVRRETSCGTRTGLVVAVDLECYDYTRGSSSLIRATEGTVEARVKTRIALREAAPIELPHILMLIDDPEHTVIEPLCENAALTPCYDFELMADGGRVRGDFLPEAALDGALNALNALAEKNDGKFGKPLLLYAMGDGNHSLAAAKAAWENKKAELSEAERENHPMRFALCELENIHDAGMSFEPIHRIIRMEDHCDEAFDLLLNILKEQNGAVSLCTSCSGKGHEFLCHTEDVDGVVRVENPVAQLPVATLQNALDELEKRMSAVEVDYIHGDDTVVRLGRQPETVGFTLPPMDKSGLFPTVILEGALPRKTFSMGHANEKRYYIEARALR